MEFHIGILCQYFASDNTTARMAIFPKIGRFFRLTVGFPKKQKGG